MWKKKEKESEPVMPKPLSPAEPPVSRSATRRPERAVIGPTIRIKGQISGGEDLLIQGRIEGTIEVKGKSVAVGKPGKIKADIHARSIRVEGEVRGDLFGEQEVIIEASGDVEGNLIAPSVRLENGSRFKGSIDMERGKQTPPVEAPSPRVESEVSDGSPAKTPAPSDKQPPLRP